DVYVYAVKSEFFGEEVAAAVRLKPEATATEEELRNFCQGKIARFKIPKYIRFVSEFPMTASGKIQKFKLRHAHENDLEPSQCIPFFMQAEHYEYLYRIEEAFWWFPGMREITAALLDPFLPPRDRVILDAGCGTGGNLEWLSRYAGNGRIIGIDLISTALDFCRERRHERLVQASATDLPFADRSFDLVTSFDVLVQIPGPGADDQAMREMIRVLKPGGV